MDMINAFVQTNGNTRLEANSEMAAKSSSWLTVTDGAWGWVVVLGSFVSHVITGGIVYSFGVLVEDFVNYFECSKREIGALGSLAIGLTWTVGNIHLHIICC